jgi:hypothetical protein
MWLVMLDAKVTNVSESTLACRSDAFRLLSPAGRQYGPAKLWGDRPDLGKDGVIEASSQQIDSGEVVEYKFIFELPPELDVLTWKWLYDIDLVEKWPQ